MQFTKRRRGTVHTSTEVNTDSSLRNNRGEFRSRQGNHQSRDSVNFPVYFLLIFICLFSFNSGNLSKETGAEVDETFPFPNCKTMLPDCECEDLSELIGISCKNVSDFWTFAQVLENGSLFPKNTTYEITLSGTRILPRQFLRGLLVFGLFIDDPRTEGLEDGAFDGVLRLRKFHVWRSSMREIPDFRHIQYSLRTLNLHNSLLTSIEGNHLKNLSFLERLSLFNNSIKYVASEAFQGTENLIIFDISNNYLQYLPPNLFNPWKQLKKAVLSNNNLLHVNQLFAVTHPQFIYLDHNNLTDLDSVLHTNMSKVEVIALSYNFFSKVTPNSFNGKVVNTRQLYLDHCQIQSFDVTHYADLRSLHFLDLSYNLLKRVVSEEIAFVKDVEIDFTGNAITAVHAFFIHSVGSLYLNKNLMTTLGGTLQFSEIRQVAIADNKIQSLERYQFLGAILVMLDLQGNLINYIEHGTFKPLSSHLKYLDLSRNKIRRLNNSVRLLYSLISLNLTDNQIEVFGTGEFQGMNELTDLYLEGNRLQTLGPEVWELFNLKNLVISNNKILSIKADQLPSTLQYVSIAGNPLQCDCRILSFLQLLNSTTNLKTDVPLCVPSNNTFQSPVRCPEGCKCFCTYNTSHHHISMNCSSIGLTQFPRSLAISYPQKFNPSSFAIFLPRNVEDKDFFSESTPFVIKDKIGDVDFSHNNLSSMKDARLSKGTKRLLLGHNLLREIPTSFLFSLEELDTATLSGNPWICDCGTSGFKNWILTHSNVILDVNETRCDPNGPAFANREIRNLTDIDLCPPYNVEYIILVGISVIGCLLISFVVLIVWKYKSNITLWLYAHGVTWFRETDTEFDKKFDVFLSFSSRDENLVIFEIIKEIQEKEPHLVFASHIGDLDCSDAILQSDRIRRSKRVVLVFSRNFLESEKCMYEFISAHMQALKDRSFRIIIIKLDNLPKDSELPEELQFYLKSDTCLTWGDKYFWNKLLYFLSSSNSSIRQNFADLDKVPV